VAFRGLNNVNNRNAVLDPLFSNVDFCPGCQFNRGILTAWNVVKTQILGDIAAAKQANPTFLIVATGHSLGGGIAIPAAMEFRKGGVADLVS
jgi:hypothetical protein